MNPFTKSKTPYLQKLFEKTKGVYISVSDYMKALGNSIAPWMPSNYCVLGTDGYGVSETREDLRNYFEISPDYICHAALVALFKIKKISSKEFKQLCQGLAIDTKKPNPIYR